MRKMRKRRKRRKRKKNNLSPYLVLHSPTLKYSMDLPVYGFMLGTV